MKRTFIKRPVLEATRFNLSQSDTKMVLNLAEDMLYQTYENYPEYSENEAYHCVLDHVILVITEMDDDNMYSEDVKKVASHKNSRFRQMIRNCVKQHYNEYRWEDM